MPRIKQRKFSTYARPNTAKSRKAFRRSMRPRMSQLMSEEMYKGVWVLPDDKTTIPIDTTPEDALLKSMKVLIPEFDYIYAYVEDYVSTGTMSGDDFSPEFMKKLLPILFKNWWVLVNGDHVTMADPIDDRDVSGLETVQKVVIPKMHYNRNKHLTFHFIGDASDIGPATIEQINKSKTWLDLKIETGQLRGEELANYLKRQEKEGKLKPKKRVESITMNLWDFLDESAEFLSHELNETLTWQDIWRSTDDGRKGRIKNVRVRPPTPGYDKKGYEYFTFNVKCYPSTEHKRQTGFVRFLKTKEEVQKLIKQHGEKNYLKMRENKIPIEVNCSCADFKYRWEVALHRHGAAPIIYSNGARPVKTNPKMSISACKHLASLGGYLGYGRFSLPTKR